MIRLDKTIFYVMALSITSISLSQPTTKKLLSELYEERAGYGIDSKEEEIIRSNGSSPVYGEMTSEGIDILNQELNLGAQDVFYDLGCGVGKIVVQLYLDTPLKKCVGVELSPTRIRHAEQVKSKLGEKKLLSEKRQLEFRKENMLETGVDDATAIYVSSTCFSEAFMKNVVDKLAQLKPGLKLVTLSRLPENNVFELVKEMIIPMSWSNTTTVYIHAKK